MEKTTVSKNKQGYGYKYTDLAQIHEYLESINARYYQYIERIDTDDYIMTVKIIDGKEGQPIRGCRVVQATLQGIKNPAQEQGSAITYARRYSLLMAFGLATEDDDAQSLTIKQATKEQIKVINGLGIDLAKMLEYYGITRIDDLTYNQANEIIKVKGGK